MKAQIIKSLAQIGFHETSNIIVDGSRVPFNRIVLELGKMIIQETGGDHFQAFSLARENWNLSLKNQELEAGIIEREFPIIGTFGKTYRTKSV
jgi:hypothetical protein